jgi:hypothetical protein
MKLGRAPTTCKTCIRVGIKILKFCRIYVRRITYGQTLFRLVSCCNGSAIQVFSGSNSTCLVFPSLSQINTQLLAFLVEMTPLHP